MAIHSTQSVKVNPIAFMASQTHMSISAPTSYITNKGIGAGLEDTSRGLGNIATLKSELQASLESAGSKPSQTSASGLGGFAMGVVLTGMSFISGPVGAVAGVVGAATSLGALTPKHFGLKGVQGGELSQPIQSQDTPSGGYVDVMGGRWGSQGEPIQVSRTATSASPAPQDKLGTAINAAHEMFSIQQLEDAIYSVGKQEKALNVAHDGMVHRVKQDGREVKFTGGIEDYDAFNASLKTGSRPVAKALNVGMGSPSAPSMG